MLTSRLTDECDINDLEHTATMADDFALTHKFSINNMDGPNKFNHSCKGNSNGPNQNKSSNSQNSTKEGNTQSGASGQKVKDLSSAKPKSGDDFQTSVKCLFCKRLGATLSPNVVQPGSNEKGPVQPWAF